MQTHSAMHTMKTTTTLGAMLLCLSTQAAIYSFNEGGVLLPGGQSSLNFSHAISGEAGSISSVVLTLNFSSQLALGGSIVGNLLLGSGTSPYVQSLSPSSPVFVAAAGSTPAYFSTTLTFAGSGSQFNQQNPNSTWTLDLWNNNGTYGNSLVSWGLNIEAVSPVPEPMNVALAVFGVMVVGTGGARWYLRRRHLHRRAYIWPL